MTPPDEALEIETRVEPTVATSEALIDACSCVLETKVVDRALPFHCTVESAGKFVPSTLSVKAGPPTTAELGTREIEGVGIILAVGVGVAVGVVDGVGVAVAVGLGVEVGIEVAVEVGVGVAVEVGVGVAVGVGVGVAVGAGVGVAVEVGVGVAVGV